MAPKDFSTMCIYIYETYLKPTISFECYWSYDFCFFQGMTDKLDFLDGDQKGPAAAGQKTKGDAAKRG